MTSNQLHDHLRSRKVQVFVAAALITLVCVINYVPILNIGLLLDDFPHIEYAYRAAHNNDWYDFLHNFYGNWGKLDVMRSYRPIISLSFLIDQFLWGMKIYGHHITNIVLLSGCSLFVCLIASDLCKLSNLKARLAIPLWSGLLFAVYPLHVESVSWVIGRVDPVCAVFYFASIWLFLRYQQSAKVIFLSCSLLTFFLALGSKEMAVTLPLVQAMIAVLYPASKLRQLSVQNWKERIVIDVLPALSFWVTLAVFSVLRTAFLGAAIGGYGATDIKTILGSWRNFSDRTTLSKIFTPVNEELRLNGSTLKLVSYPFWAIGFLTLLRLRSPLLRPLTFLSGWAVVALLPTFQIWHIYPNLVGSRLFYISSAPFCIGIALVTLAPLSARLQSFSKWANTAGMLLLCCLFLSWSWLLQNNLSPFITAGKHMQNLQNQLDELAKSLNENNKVLLLNLPPDYEGAGMVTKAWYLEQICRPPFNANDINGKFVTSEPIVSGGHDYIWPNELTSILRDTSVKQHMIWNQEQGRFVEWKMIPLPTTNELGSGKEYDLKQASFSPKTWSGDSTSWHSEQIGEPGVEHYPEFVRLHAAQRNAYPNQAPPAMTIWFPATDVNPLNQNLATIKLTVNGNASDFDKIKFVWSNGQASLTKCEGTDNDYQVWLGRYKSWTLNDSPKRIGISLAAGNYSVDLRQLKLINDNSIKPQLLINGKTALPGIGIKLTEKSADKLSWQIPKAASVTLRISRSNLPFDPNIESEIMLGPAGNLLEERKFLPSTDSIELKDLHLNPGATHLQVLAVDSAGNRIGLPSEPVAVSVAQ